MNKKIPVTISVLFFIWGSARAGKDVLFPETEIEDRYNRLDPVSLEEEKELTKIKLEYEAKKGIIVMFKKINVDEEDITRYQQTQKG